MKCMKCKQNEANVYITTSINGKVKKEYIAIVEGNIISDGRIDAPIYRPDPIITLER